MRRRIAALLVLLLLGGAGSAFYLWGPLGDPRIRAADLCHEAEEGVRQGDLDRALAAYRRAMQADPSSARALAGAGRVQFRRKVVHEAAGYLARAADLSGADALVWLDLGRALRAAARPADAVAACRRAATLSPGRADVWVELGGALLDQRSHAEAEEAFRRAESLAPDVPEVLTGLGRLFTQTGRADSAADALARAVSTRPGDAGLLRDLGGAELRAGRMEEAVVHLTQALSVAPRLTEARYLLGRAYLRMGREAEGRRELEAFARQTRFAGRISMLEKSAAERPSAETYLELSRIYGEMGQDSLSTLYLTRATGIDPMKAVAQEVDQFGRR